MISWSSIPWDQLLIGLLLVVFVSGTAVYFNLKLFKTVWWATIRSIVQLAVLGKILFWLFKKEEPLTLILTALFMTIVASWTVRERTTHRYRKQFRFGLVSILLSVAFNGAYMLFLTLPQVPWYAPSKAIPLIGMLLGNSLNGITLGMDKFVSDIKNQSSVIEARLAIGASSFEAVEDIFRESLKTGITPIINAMMIVGLVSIPGMMTGQMLGGSAAIEAAFYQIMIMIMILSCTFFSVLLCLYFSYKTLIASKQRLCSEALL